MEKSFLVEEYLVKRKTTREIALENNVGVRKIKHLLKQYNINAKNRISKTTKLLTKDFLEEQYIALDKSMIEIGKENNLSYVTISNALTKNNIPKKPGTRKNKKNKKPFPYKDDINIGDELEHLTVIEKIGGKLRCMCKCGNIKLYFSSRIRNKQVKSCGCFRNRKTTKNPLFKGCGEIPLSVYKKYKTNAFDRFISFSITIEDLNNQYKKQKGLCSLTKKEIRFDDGKTIRNGSASLDRIDSNKGYEVNNIQWVHKDINQMKWTYDQDDFIKLCKLVAENN